MTPTALTSAGTSAFATASFVSPFSRVADYLCRLGRRAGAEQVPDRFAQELKDHKLTRAADVFQRHAEGRPRRNSGGPWYPFHMVHCEGERRQRKAAWQDRAHASHHCR